MRILKNQPHNARSYTIIGSACAATALIISMTTAVMPNALETIAIAKPASQEQTQDTPTIEQTLHPTYDHAIDVTEQIVSPQLDQINAAIAAEEQRQAEAQAEAERQAQAEAEAQAEAQRQAEAEAQRQAEAEAEAQTQQQSQSQQQSTRKIPTVYSDRTYWVDSNEAQANLQSVVDTGGLIAVHYNKHGSLIYTQHNNTGGAWMLKLNVGDTVRIDDVTYTVVDIHYMHAGDSAPTGGTYLQTCNYNGGINVIQLSAN